MNAVEPIPSRSASTTVSARRPARRVLLPVGAAVVGALLLAGCTGQAEPGASTPPPTAPSESPGPSESPTPTPAPSASDPEESATLAIWSMVDTRAGMRLVREHLEVTGADPAVAAVERMIAGPADPDYTSPWAASTEVLGVGTEGGTIVVDLSEDARTASIGSEGAALMIQQLVYTVTDAVGEPARAVQLLIEGEPAGELWGVVSWDEPVVRADPLDVRSLVQIDEPAEGETVGTTVTVTGEAAVFEASFTWTVLDASGTQVQEGFDMTSEGQTFAPFSFAVELEPGTWTIVVTEDDPSDGEGGTPMSDSRTVVVE